MLLERLKQNNYAKAGLGLFSLLLVGVLLVVLFRSNNPQGGAVRGGDSSSGSSLPVAMEDVFRGGDWETEVDLFKPPNIM
jgi:hypothetical protein